MSTNPRRTRRRSVLGATLALAAGALTFGAGGTMASATIACQDRVTSQAFSFAGDSNDYFAAPNGAFDATTNWGFQNYVGLIDGVNAPLNLAKGQAKRAAFLTNATVGYSSQNSVSSTDFCVKGNEDAFRFFLRPYGKNPGNLDVWLYVTDPTATVGFRWQKWSISPSAPGHPYGRTGWFYTDRLGIAWSPYDNDTQNVSIQFGSSNADSKSGWYVDDVMIDPWRTL